MLRKMRVWDHSTQCMIYAEEPAYQGEHAYFPYRFSIGYQGWNKDSLTFMESVGISDCTLRPIFVYDLLSSRESQLLLVLWDKRYLEYIGYGVHERLNGFRFGSDWQVIGNLFETPHLLPPDFSRESIPGQVEMVFPLHPPDTENNDEKEKGL